MKSVPKLIRRFVGIFLLSSILILVVNFLILVIIASTQAPNSSPWKTAEEAADEMQKNENGYFMSAKMEAALNSENIWAVYVDNHTGAALWYSDNLPEGIPLNYTLSDVANLTRGYIDGYPTFPSEGEDGILVLGYPKDSYWKHMWASWDYHFIANLPKIAVFALTANIFVILCIYIGANTKLLKSVKPITDGLQALPTEQPVVLKENGILSEISAKINQTSEILQLQKFQLQKKETARANWIAGVSHDIRTPLSMIMGYAGQLEDDRNLSDGEHQKAAVIVRQSKRMRDLISDLNLASKLEYNMQPIHVKKINIIAVVRQVVVDFINLDIDNKYPIEWLTDEALLTCTLNADEDLIKRAVSNLIQNCINHNENGCKIFVIIKTNNTHCSIIVSDDGVGVTDAQMDRLNHSPHYMVCDESTSEQRHGLGLLIVKQIIAAHNGEIQISHSEYGGFEVELFLPL